MIALTDEQRDFVEAIRDFAKRGTSEIQRDIIGKTLGL